MATKTGRGVTNYKGFPPMKLHDPLLTWFCEMTRQTQIIIFTTAMPMITKLCRTVTYVHTISWSCKIT